MSEDWLPFIRHSNFVIERMRVFVRRVLLLAFAALVVGAIVYGLRPMPVEADLAQVVRGEVLETVDQDGKTRIREKYIVSAPLAGRLLRIDLEPGDEVQAGTLLASIEPRDPDLLDARAVMQAEAAVKAAEANLDRAVPLQEEAIANQEYAEAELKRVRGARAANPGAVTDSDVEAKLMAFRTRSALVRSAQHAVDIARFELEQAKAALVRSRPREDNAAATDGDEGPPGPNGWHFNIRAPVSGRVLRVFQESGGFMQAGTNLLELGDPEDLEVEIDVLSREAVKIKPDAPVLLEHWGGAKPLDGRVRLVEPSAFTKISTLGVEEQRVNVIVDLVDPPKDREALGDGFRVEARIVVAKASGVVKVPSSALFRVGDEWAVFRVEDGVARQRMVKIGLENGLEAEVLDGLAEGDQVVTHPGDNVLDGVEVRPR
jgi:HlyD family secretion protein